MPKTSAQMAANWNQGMSSPSTAQKYKDGINSFQGNPMALAATDQAQQLYLTNTAASVSSGKRAAKLNSVPVQRWKDNAINVGSTQLSSGAVKAKQKVADHFTKWQPIYQQASAAAKALPKGGQANALARVQAAMQVMMQAAGRA